MQHQSTNSKKQLELEKQKAELKKRIDRVREQENQVMFELATKDRSKKRFKREPAQSEKNDDEFLLDDYESDDEKKASKKTDTNSNLSKEVQDLLAK